MNDGREALRTWLDLLTVSSAFKKAIDANLRNEFGVTISRFDIMSALDRAGADGLRAGALTQRLKVSDGNTTQVIAGLTKEGLVKRKVSPDDGRVVIFKLTAKGRNRFAKMAEEHKDWVSDAFSGMSETQMKTMRKLLSQIRPPTTIAKNERNAA